MTDIKKANEIASELSAQIWSIANDLRGGMDANEFRNYILGTIFYRYLSERVEDYMLDVLSEDDMTYKEAFLDEEYKPLVEKWSIDGLGYKICDENPQACLWNESRFFT